MYIYIYKYYAEDPILHPKKKKELGKQVIALILLNTAFDL